MSTLRPATLQDVAQIADLIREVGAELDWPRPDDPHETTARVGAHLAQCLAEPASHGVWVAEQDGRVDGYVAVHWLPCLLLPAPSGHVSELFVRPGRRDAGLGRALLQTVEAEARRRGAFRLELCNKRDRESYRRGFYRKSGWTERDDLAVFNRVLGSGDAPAQITPTSR